MLTPDQITEICERRERGQTSGQIARRYGCHPETVRYHCAKLGAEPPHPPALWSKIVGPQVMKRGDHIVRRLTPAEDAEILRLAGQGARRVDIARALKRTPGSIRNRLIRFARLQARKEAEQ